MRSVSMPESVRNTSPLSCGSALRYIVITPEVTRLDDSRSSHMVAVRPLYPVFLSHCQFRKCQRNAAANARKLFCANEKWAEQRNSLAIGGVVNHRPVSIALLEELDVIAEGVRSWVDGDPG